MGLISKALVVVLVLLSPCAPAQGQQPPDDARNVRIVSWNISGNSFVTHQQAFRAMMRHTRPDVLVLDEVVPSVTAEQLRDVLSGIDPEDERPWNVDYGTSGGRQRGVIASRWPMERSPAFSGIVEYPDKPRQRITAQMTEQELQWASYGMDGGIPVNGAVVVTDGGRLLVVAVDLQCCGGERNDWQEYRRQIESREIRKRANLAMQKGRVDGAVIAGDLNTVGTPYPVLLLLGPYRPPHFGLLAAEILHLDGEESWTWDGRGTQFPSSILDYQLYGSHGLQAGESFVFDTEDLDAETLDSLGLQVQSSSQLSRHRPLVVDYSWR